MKINIPTLVLLDPALREFGGHHPGVIETLSKTRSIIDKKFKLLVYANEDCTPELVDKLSMGESIVVRKYFKTDFYKYFYDKKKINTFNTYIHTLVNEYYSIFKAHKACATTFYYHTLNWEHAYALALAISLFNQNDEQRHKHIVGLMYNPCKFKRINTEVVSTEPYDVNFQSNHGYGNIDNDRLFKFTLGFGLLGKNENVFFFATEYELKKYYENILKKEIDWCPCGLISHNHLNEINNRFCIEFNNKNKCVTNLVNKGGDVNVLLYLGDAKVNKGFLALPNMLISLLTNITNKNVVFIIQYTLTNKNIDLVSTHKQLQEISSQNRRVTIMNDFLTDKELHELLLRTNHIVFNYNGFDYSNQSSGVLWLAAAYKMHIYLLTNTWLNREAERLNCKYYMASNTNQLIVFMNTHTRASYSENTQRPLSNTKHIKLYQSRLFSDLGSWLNDKLISEGSSTWKI